MEQKEIIIYDVETGHFCINSATYIVMLHANCV